jgi:hypothetical protein
MKSLSLKIGLALSATTLVPGCAYRHHDHEHAHQHQHEHEHEQHAHYAPGLGEIMAQSAVRHAKLWFAGQAQNWDLAAYEVDELREGFEDAGKYHPTHKQIAQPIPDLISQNMDQPLVGVEQAIKDKNLQTFVKNYDNLTAACNACHQATEFGFNRVSRPNFNPFANQSFRISD